MNNLGIQINNLTTTPTLYDGKEKLVATDSNGVDSVNLFLNDIITNDNVAQTTFGSNNYVLSKTYNPSSLFDGFSFRFFASGTNAAGATMDIIIQNNTTLQNSVNRRTLKKFNNGVFVNLDAGDIIANNLYDVIIIASEAVVFSVNAQVNKATAAEINNGSVDNKFITPAGLANANYVTLNDFVTNSDGVIFPNGLIYKKGEVFIPPQTTTNIAFNAAFPNVVHAVIFSRYGLATTSQPSDRIVENTRTTAAFALRNESSSEGAVFNWIAFGS